MAKPKNAAQMKAEMAVGRARAPTQYELAHQAAQISAARPIAQGGLGLRLNNTAAERAEAMGLSVDSYHGTTAKPFPGFRSNYAEGQGTGVYSSTNASDTAEFSEGAGGQTMPLKVSNKLWNERKDEPPATVEDTNKFYDDVEYRNKTLKDAGYHGVISPQANGLTGDEILMFDPKHTRSRFAAFDPDHAESSDMLKAHGGVVRMAGGGRPPLRSLDEVPSDEYLKAELARINAAPTVRANSADETANYARYVAERADQPIEMPARPDYTPGFSVLEKPTYGSEVPGTTPTIDQQRYELTMKGQQDAANKRYRAQQGDALAGMDPTSTLAVTDAARTMGLGMLALPVHAGRSAFHYLQHGNMKDAPTGMDYEEFMSPRTAEGAELVEEIGTAGSRLTGSEMGFGLNPTLWAYAPPTMAQMRAGLKLGAERAAPVIKDIGAMANERYLTGKMPGMVAPASPVTTWHGTPHNIEGNKFDNAKIGTGEGNQSFGYGHYSAGSKGVGENYRDTLSVDPNQASENIKESTLKKFLPNESPRVQEQIKGFLSGLGYYDDFKVTIMREGSDAFKAALLKEEPLLFSGGNLYKIDIPDPVVEKMLDWDKPLKDQSPHVQKALAKISPDQYGPDSPDYDPRETGATIYQRIASIANSKVSPEWIKKRDLLMKKVQVEGDSAMPELTAHLDKAPRADKLGSELLLKNGITGNKYLDGGSHGVGSGTQNFVVFDPKYAKFLEKNGEPIEQPKVTAPTKALAPANEQGFYSPTEAAALNLQRQSGNGQAFLNDILKGENVRAEEVSGMGLDTWLKGKKEVTAAEVQDYIAQNKLGLSESSYGTAPKLTPDEKTRLTYLDEENRKSPLGAIDDRLGEGTYTELMRLENIRDRSSVDSLYDQAKQTERRAQQMQRQGMQTVARALFTQANHFNARAEALDLKGAGIPKPTKFGQYQLPGGENYREVVITMPTKVDQRGFFIDRDGDKFYLRNHDGKTLGEYGSRYEAQEAMQKNTSQDYKSSHFDEPNILAHLRMSDRVTDGKKTLLVDEVQSDWHQAGREQGYVDPQAAEKIKQIETIKKEFDTLNKKRYELYAQAKETTDDNLPQFIKLTEEADGITKKMLELNKQMNDLEHLKRTQERAIPNAPYKEDWYQLALRRAVKEAIDGGYDRVALPTGARVNERFSLTKHVDAVRANLNPDGTYAVGVKPIGKNMQKFDQSVPADKLASILGKDLANKITSEVNEVGVESGKIFSGLDLKVGGEGNKKYYDEIYPNYLKKFGKKYGATVGKTTTPTEYARDAQGIPSRYPKEEPLFYMEITPAMRKEFSTGIHMAKGGKVSFAKSADDMRKELLRNKHG